MPELPEIETVKRQLEEYLIGQTITELTPLHVKPMHGNPALVIGNKIIAIGRRGKLLMIELENDLFLAIHFKMSGQLLLALSVKGKGKRVLLNRHTRVIFHFQNGDKLYFNDQRRFGWIKVLTREEFNKLPFLQKLGPEIWDISEQEFYERIIKRKKAIKLVIMDQEVIAGIGNIYTNDALWEAGIAPTRSAQRLGNEETKRLRRGLIKVLEDGMKYGGATASDLKYKNIFGTSGTYQEHFRVYAREGQSCLRGDGGVIKKIRLGGRGTYFCPHCQKLSF